VRGKGRPRVTFTAKPESFLAALDLAARLAG
jgi:hypothetical protein